MADWSRAFALIRGAGCRVGPGLTAEELARAEARFGLRFPPDLADLLRQGLPLDSRFPDWRADDAGPIEALLAWPLEGLLLDVEENRFWMEEWGPRPAGLAAAKERAAAAVRAAPRLIPLHGHRYLPAEPHQAGNPVLSVYQADVICYGHDLASWFEAELGAGPETSIRHDAVRPIRFWGRVMELNQ